ncbi:MAG: hypothetical protein Fues2KO_54760 [Fuerstiella sp.]
MKVNFEQLEVSSDQSYWHDGKPFSGVAVYRREDGTLESEVMFEDGTQSGPFSDFHSDGRIACAGVIQNGVNHGDFKYWDRNGRLTKTESYEFGICTSRQEYDEAGNVISDYTIAEDDSNAALLAAYRNQIR